MTCVGAGEAGRVVADSNIWVSALIWGGKPLELIELAIETKIDLATSPDILDETIRVLREKIGLDTDDLHKAGGFMRKAARVVKPIERLNVVQSEPDDNRVLECAASAEADTVVSGDTDLLRLGSFRAIRIVKVSEFLVSFQRRAR